MNDVFDISGFRSFLLADEKRFRLDGLSLWYNSIPLPVDLFEFFFDSWRKNFKLYLDHLMVALMLEEALVIHSELGLSVEEFPNVAKVNENKGDLFRVVSERKTANIEFKGLSQELAGVLSVENYQLDVGELIGAASVDGKKYKRLFVPKRFREIINRRLPNALKHVATSNGDMFGNVMADDLKLYRAGFGDALAGIFNKLLEYKIDKCSGYIAVTSSSILHFNEDESGHTLLPVIQERTTDGSLWEPFFDGQIKIRLNPRHPHYEAITKCNNPEATLELLSVMSKLEMNCSNGNELKMLENIRAKVSRELWVST